MTRALGRGGSVAAVLVALAASSGAAQATSCCEARKTPDGFVALRQKPSPDAPLIIKVPSGEAVCFGTEKPKEKAPRSWDYGMYVDPARVPHWGWINRRLLSRQCG